MPATAAGSSSSPSGDHRQARLPSARQHPMIAKQSEEWASSLAAPRRDCKPWWRRKPMIACISGPAVAPDRDGPGRLSWALTPRPRLSAGTAGAFRTPPHGFQQLNEAEERDGCVASPRFFKATAAVATARQGAARPSRRVA